MTAAIVLLEPKDAAGRWVDELTGGRGYSHALVDPGWPDRRVIDCTLRDGIRISGWLEAVGDRPYRRLELELGVGARLVDELVARVGERFDLGAAIGVITGNPNLCHGVYCSAVIAACLPPELRARLPPCVAPSDFLELGGGR